MKESKLVLVPNHKREQISPLVRKAAVGARSTGSNDDENLCSQLGWLVSASERKDGRKEGQMGSGEACPENFGKEGEMRPSPNIYLETPMLTVGEPGRCSV